MQDEPREETGRSKCAATSACPCSGRAWSGPGPSEIAIEPAHLGEPAGSLDTSLGLQRRAQSLDVSSSASLDPLPEEVGTVEHGAGDERFQEFLLPRKKSASGTCGRSARTARLSRRNASQGRPKLDRSMSTMYDSSSVSGGESRWVVTMTSRCTLERNGSAPRAAARAANSSALRSSLSAPGMS